VCVPPSVPSAPPTLSARLLKPAAGRRAGAQL
jgi:hypothetical protein